MEADDIGPEERFSDQNYEEEQLNEIEESKRNSNKEFVSIIMSKSPNIKNMAYESSQSDDYVSDDEQTIK